MEFHRNPLRSCLFPRIRKRIQTMVCWHFQFCPGSALKAHTSRSVGSMKVATPPHCSYLSSPVLDLPQAVSFAVNLSSYYWTVLPGGRIEAIGRRSCRYCLQLVGFGAALCQFERCALGPFAFQRLVSTPIQFDYLLPLHQARERLRASAWFRRVAWKTLP